RYGARCCRRAGRGQSARHAGRQGGVTTRRARQSRGRTTAAILDSQAGLRQGDVKHSESAARMPVNTGRMPRLSAGVVVVRRAAAECLFLLLRAYRNWDFPKGVVEPGEDPLAAARREVREETLIEDLQFNWGEV